MTRDEIKNFRQTAKNQTIAGDRVQRLLELYKLKYKVTLAEAEKLVKNEHVALWHSYMTGAPLPKVETSKIYEL